MGHKAHAAAVWMTAWTSGSWTELGSQTQAYQHIRPGQGSYSLNETMAVVQGP